MISDGYMSELAKRASIWAVSAALVIIAVGIGGYLLGTGIGNSRPPVVLPDGWKVVKTSNGFVLQKVVEVFKEVPVSVRKQVTVDGEPRYVEVETTRTTKMDVVTREARLLGVGNMDEAKQLALSVIDTLKYRERQESTFQPLPIDTEEVYTPE